MSSQALQAKAQALNAKIEGEAQATLDDIDRNLVRKIARASYACVVKCYDTAGTTGRTEVLSECARQCQVPYQHANAIVQDEIQQFQSRLNRAMADCNDQARDLMTPGTENDPSKMTKVEDTLIKCMSKTVDSHIALLPAMKKRIQGRLKELS